MNRRVFLQSLAAALAAAGLPAPPQSFIDSVPEVVPPIIQIPQLGGINTFRISFPDGSTWEFQGFVVAEVHHAPVDDLMTVEVSVRPTGEPTLVESDSPGFYVNQNRKAGPVAQGVAVSVMSDEFVFKEVAELREVTLPRLERNMTEFVNDDGYLEAVPGLKRMSDMTFTVNFTKS